MSFHVKVVIVGFRNCDDVARCLGALEGSRYADFSIIICENGGASAYARLIATLPKALAAGQPIEVVLAPSNLGYAGGVNFCLRRGADPDGWWLLNPDTAPHPGALQALVERLRQGDCDASGGVLLFGDGRVQNYGGWWRPWLARAHAIGYGAGINDRIDHVAVEARLSYLSGASMLVSRRFVQVAGMMREDYFLYAEEVEWCLRAQRLGLRLGFSPSAHIDHAQGSSTGRTEAVAGRSRLSIYLDERNKFLVTRDIFPQLLPVVAVSTLFLLTLRFAARGALSSWLFALQGWLAGLRGERGRPTWAPD